MPGHPLIGLWSPAGHCRATERGAHQQRLGQDFHGKRPAVGNCLPVHLTGQVGPRRHLHRAGPVVLELAVDVVAVGQDRRAITAQPSTC